LAFATAAAVVEAATPTVVPAVAVAATITVIAVITAVAVAVAAAFASTVTTLGDLTADPVSLTSQTLAIELTQDTRESATSAFGSAGNPTHLLAVEILHGVLGVARVFKGDESKAWGFAGDPDGLDPAELAKDIVDVALFDAFVEVSEVYLKRDPVRG